MRLQRTAPSGVVESLCDHAGRSARWVQGIVECLAVPNTPPCKLVWNAMPLGVLKERGCDVVACCVQLRASAVSGLFGARCPAAVVRLVATVIVDAVYGVLQRRPFAHVAEKGFEAIPSFTDGDALRAVFHVAGVVGVEAPHTNGDTSVCQSFHACWSCLQSGRETTMEWRSRNCGAYHRQDSRRASCDWFRNRRRIQAAW
jgi:hypothetical protein